MDEQPTRSPVTTNAAAFGPPSTRPQSFRERTMP
ncbi:hypothetical protein pipiens_000656, partial [Culex pipiens pipiens]